MSTIDHVSKHAMRTNRKATRFDFTNQQSTGNSTDSSGGEQSPRHHHQHLWAHGHKTGHLLSNCVAAASDVGATDTNDGERRGGGGGSDMRWDSWNCSHTAASHQNCRLEIRSQSDTTRDKQLPASKERISRKLVLNKSHRSWPSGGAARR